MQISIKRCKIPNQIWLTESKYIKDNLHNQILNRSYFPNKIRILWRETKDGGYVFSTEDERKWARVLARHLNWKNLLTFGQLVNWEMRKCELSSCPSFNDALTSGRSLPAPGTLLRHVESCWPYTSKKPGPDNETSFLQDVVVDPSACSGLLSKSHWILICCWQRQGTCTFIPTSLITWPGWNLLLTGHSHWLS